MAAPAHPSTASVAWPSSRRFVSSGSAAPRGAAAGAPPIWLDLAPTSRCADGGACTPQHCECSMAFLTPLRLEWIGVRAGRDRWRLLAPLRDRTESGGGYTVPDGYETDGESRPPLTMPLSGPPCTRSGVLHDWLGDRIGVPVEQAHALYREALLSEGLDPVWAEQRFAAVSYWDQRTRA